MGKDLRDEIFGKLIVVDKEVRKWYCLCECGGFIRATSAELLKEDITHCGCQTLNHKVLANHAGKRHDKLVALYPVGSYRGSARWMYQCDCGRYRKAMPSDIKKYEKASCGCDRTGAGKRPGNIYETVKEVCRIYYDGETKRLDRGDFRKIDRGRSRDRSQV